jgi:hypothetical protein
VANPIGLQLVEKLGSDIYAAWQLARERNPGEDDLLAVIGHDGKKAALTIMRRADFVTHMRETGRWVDGSAWETVLEPAGDKDETLRSEALWVVVHPAEGFGEAEILRLVSPTTTAPGGDA